MRERIIILGIDGLEYNLVEEFKLDAIKQKAYCKLDLSDYNIIVTPPIWASIITGKIIDEIEKPFLRRQKIVGDQNIFKKILWKKIGNKILPKKIKRWIAGSTIFGNPFEVTKDYLLSKYKGETIFDFFERAWTNGIPSYGRNDNTPKNRKLHQKAVEGDVRPYHDHVVEVYKKDKDALLSVINGKKEYDMIFWYTTLLDSLGHVYIRRKLKLMRYYFEINNLVKKIKEYVPDSIIYIISDHGMEEGKYNWGNHSGYGFFSSNTGELIKKPKDLFYLVKEKATKRFSNRTGTRRR